MKKIILFTTSLAMASGAYAGGYRVSIQGQQALGMGHAGVAMSDSAETVFFNPAAMTRLESEQQLTAGITFLSGETIFQNETTGATADTDNPIGTPLNVYFVSSPEDDNFAFGLGLYTPYGNSVEWPTDWSGSHLVNNIELKAIFVQPTLAYKFNDSFSVGFGPAFASGVVDFNRNLSTSLVDNQGNRSNVTISASNVDAWGYNLGFMITPSQDFSIGISYRSKITLEARGGEADFENIPSSLVTVFADTTFDADLILPAELTIGIAYNLSENTTIAVDINQTYWSEYESLDVQFNNGAGLSSNPRNWEDASIYRIGVQHQLNEDLTLRAGLYLDKTPIKEGYFAPETPRNDATGFTAGASFKLAENLDLDLSFLYITSNEFDAEYDHYNQSGTEVPFGGTYETTATSIGAGINYKF